MKSFKTKKIILDFADPAEQQRILERNNRNEIIGWLCWNDPDGCYSDSDSIMFGQPYLDDDLAREIMVDQLAGVLPKTPADCRIDQPPVREGYRGPGPMARKRLAALKAKEAAPLIKLTFTHATTAAPLGSEPAPEPFRLQAPPKPFRRSHFENNAAKSKGALFAGADCLPGQSNLFNPDGKEPKS